MPSKKKTIARINEERDAFAAQIAELEADLIELIEDRASRDSRTDPESNDGDSLSVEADGVQQRLSNLRSSLDQCDDALARVEAGTYGTCVGCATKIPDERLEYLPFTTECVSCKASGGGIRR